MKKYLISAAFGLMAVLLFGQHDHSQVSQTPSGQGELNATTEAMGRGHNHEEHQHMAAHMHMTELRQTSAGDSAKAKQVVEQARPALEKYRDYKVALDEGFKIFLPNVPQKMYHFTNYQNAIGEAFRFDAAKPTSLLYEKHGDDYKLIGAMYTAPARYSEEELDKRVPLSIAQWHQHVNLCKPPDDRRNELFGPSPRFGLAGSISTQQECEAAGGKLIPRVFGWMVHLYPYEQSMDSIWSVERQKNTVDMSKDMSAMPHQHNH